MCLIFLALNHHADYKLVVAANRDEFYQRKTEAAHFWNERPVILGGRDLEAGGTWLGMTRQGRISMITNFRDPKNINPKAPSRGHLVSHYLESDQDPKDYLTNVEAQGKLFNGFNLVAGNANELYYYSNYSEGVQRITNGIHGLSNHLLDTPWPKVTIGKQRFETLLQEKTLNPSSLFALLFNDALAPDEQLPDTGVGLERERVLSAMFIKSPGYGTRCSTVILIDKSDNVQFVERVFDLNTFQFTENKFNFRIEKQEKR